MKCARTLCMLIASTLTACSTISTAPSVDPRRALVRAACPDLTELQEKDFGSTTLKLIEVAGQYYKCQAAALGESE